MRKKIGIIFLGISILAFSKPEIVYDEETKKPLNGYIEYTDKETNKKVIEEDYREGIITEKREYYNSGVIKSISKYDEGEVYLEKNFFEDGKLSLKKIYKDGVARTTLDLDSDGIKVEVSEDYRVQKQTNEKGFVRVFYKENDIFEEPSKDILEKTWDKEVEEEEKETGTVNYKREYRYGILEKESYSEVGNGFSKEVNKKLEDNILSVYEKTKKLEEDFPLPRIEEREVKYFPNGNKKYEKISKKGNENKLYEEERVYDESEKILTEKKYVNNDLKDSFQDKDYKKYKEEKESKNYKIKYSNGKIAYEKESLKNGIEKERYFTKKGVLTFESESYPEIYKITVKKMADENTEESVVRKLKNLKKYSEDGKLFYEENFEENEESIKFFKTSYYKNGKINFREVETIIKSSRKRSYKIEKYLEDGKLVRSIYHDDKEINKKFYDENQKLKYEKVLKEEKEKTVDNSIYYYENGKIRKENEVISTYTSDKFTTRIYNINGELEKEYN